MKQVMQILLVIAILFALWAAFSYFSESGETVVPNENPSNGEEEGGGALQNQQKTISLYFYNEEADTDSTGNILCSPDAVVATERTVEDYSVRNHIEMLLKGPTEEEKRSGLSSEFPLQGLSLESVQGPNAEGVLTLTLSDSQNSTVGGSCRVGILAAQLIQTALSIEGVESVEVLPEDMFQP